MASEFTIVRRFHCTPPQFWELIHGSREFNEAVHRDHLGFAYEVLHDDPASGLWSTRVTPDIPLPEALKRALGADGFSYVEDGKRDTVSNVYRFAILPSVFPDKVKVNAELSLVPVGTDSCERTLRVHLDVRVFGIGGMIESFVERALRKSYEDTGAFTDAWLDRKLGRVRA